MTHKLIFSIPLLLGLSTAAPGQTHETEPSAVRWSRLIANVLSAFGEERRDAVANVQADYSTRALYVRNANGVGWTGRIVTQDELANGDLAALAARFYDAANAPKRWARLHARLLDEFAAKRIDATGAIASDFTTRVIRVRCRPDGAFVSKTITEEQLAWGDLGALASSLLRDSGC
jgi:hypothetical protein